MDGLVTTTPLVGSTGEKHEDGETKLVAQQLSELIIAGDSSCSQDSEIAKEIDTMLIRLSEFLDVIDLIRSDTNLCLKTTLPLITDKAQQLDDICTRIDQLEMFVGFVEKTLVQLESQTKEAESHFSTVKNIKKTLTGMFSKIGRRNQEITTQHSQYSSNGLQSTVEDQLVTIFSTEQVFRESDGEIELGPELSSVPDSALDPKLESETNGDKAHTEPDDEPRNSQAT